MFTRFLSASFTSLLTCLALAFFVACQGSEDRPGYVVMKGVEVYRAPQGAKIVKSDELNTFDVDHYDRLFNHHPSINQPLYRLVEAGGYKMYIGIVLDKDIQGPMPDLFAGDSVWTLIDSRTVPQGKIGFLKNDSLYNVRLVGKTHKVDMMPLLNLKTPDSTLADRYYHADSLFKGDYLL